MGARRPLLIALAISLLGHLAFVGFFPRSQQARPVARFDLELLPAAEPQAVAEVQTSPDEVSKKIPAETEVPETEVPEPDELREEPPPAVATVIEATPEAVQTPPGVELNLALPPDWQEILKEVPAPSRALAFNPSLGAAVQRRQVERQRLALVAGRQAAVYGVADEDYARTGPLGQELKMKGGCVTLREDKGVEEGQRWWAGQCSETRQNRFTLPEIEYDAIGRAVVD